MAPATSQKASKIPRLACSKPGAASGSPLILSPELIDGGECTSHLRHRRHTHLYQPAQFVSPTIRPVNSAQCSVPEGAIAPAKTGGGDRDKKARASDQIFSIASLVVMALVFCTCVSVAVIKTATSSGVLVDAQVQVSRNRSTRAPSANRTEHARGQLKAPRASSSLDTAASARVDERSYLSPQEHEALMRSQQSHYEGAGEPEAPRQKPVASLSRALHDDASAAVDEEGDGAGSDGAPEPNRAMSHAGGDAGSHTGSHAGRQQAAPALEKDDADDDDYGDEQPQPHAQTLVPENRRVFAGHQLPQPAQWQSDDLDGHSAELNDDVYFSRKPASAAAVSGGLPRRADAFSGSDEVAGDGDADGDADEGPGGVGASLGDDMAVRRRAFEQSARRGAQNGPPLEPSADDDSDGYGVGDEDDDEPLPPASALAAGSLTSASSSNQNFRRVPRAPPLALSAFARAPTSSSDVTQQLDASFARKNVAEKPYNPQDNPSHAGKYFIN